MVCEHENNIVFLSLKLRKVKRDTFSNIFVYIIFVNTSENNIIYLLLF